MQLLTTATLCPCLENPFAVGGWPVYAIKETRRWHVRLGSNNTLNFGKSEAKFQMETYTGITFAEMAGVEEAKLPKCKA